MLNYEQTKYATNDILKVKEMLNIIAPNWVVSESLWEQDPIDTTIIDTTNSSFVRYAEIKGRTMSIHQYGDIIVDTNKIDFINNRVNETKNYCPSWNIAGLLFYVFHIENIVASIRTDVYVQNATLKDQIAKKSMASNQLKQKHWYKLDIFKPNGDVNYGVNLFDLNTKSIIKNQYDLLPFC